MLNPIVIPLVPMVGAVTANLTELIRGESKTWHPNIDIGMKTFIFAIAAYVVVWFALLVTAIIVGGTDHISSGLEVIGLFLLGLGFYTWGNGRRFVSSELQLWLYRLALPGVLLSCGVISYFG
ncbi:hypothetical protein HRJ35_15440 [Shewanella oneidensis MR-1]|uniref:Predicted inner membrane protein n=1 Tax=Shewanella oneidensis (strain ATCC 700550 / JCM 31522 / CIP 106686 / LMG 19005 / NCIMB 14063 / MR-1) TaxID=211586 RepID=Q8EDH6_SHEON|nr:hypothetical protein [Shewanella oneidensis]AAN55798.1 predicted inner membrane protein [Shewanella oneidensis MR-1]MDX5995565.1 hypothetical protein [Shewanella oneidensis]MEE2027771.1 hypothetical protein [Shewanella oneidensis]QKG97264.1 hypothetical protein HRJ35_15440 [Shewanella oneidensis MR-1]